MNLIQIQERLKEVPLNAVIAYANGSNPEVPPYLALAEIQRRNKVQESAQTAMPPDSSVKEQIERKAMEQSANQLMVDQARQQQAAQQLTQQMGQQSQQIPQDVPQPEQPTQMAAGGIASVPVGDMFKFDSGGIVAFADGGIDEVDNPFKDTETKEKPRTRSAKPAPRQAQRQPTPRQPSYLEQAEEQLRNMAVPQIQSPQEALTEAAKTNPSLQQPAGSAYEKMLQSLAEQDVKNRQAFEQREEEASNRDLWNSLIAAGEATRGGRGIGALLGGFGRSYGASREAADERRARQEALRREQDLNMAKLNAEIENLRRAEARGDVEAQRKHAAEIAKLEIDLRAKKAEGFKDLAQVKSLQDYYQGMLGVQRAQLGQQQTPEFVKLVNFFKQRNPNLTDEQAYEMAVKYSRAGIAGEYGMEKANAQIIQKIQEKYRMQLDMARQSKNKSLEEQIIRQMEDDIRRATGAVPGQSQAPSTPSGFTVTREK